MTLQKVLFRFVINKTDMKKIYLSIASLLTFGLMAAQAPTLVSDFRPGPDNFAPTNITVFGNSLYFSGDDATGTSSGGVDVGRELYVSDGTAAGTSLVLDIRTGTSGSSPFNFFEYNGALYFTANDGAAELWTTDGTAAGTVKVDILPSVNGDVPNLGTVYIQDVFLTVNANGNNNQLFEWSGFDTSGNIAGDFALDSVNPASIVDVREIIEFDNGLYLYMNYSPDDAQNIGLELYKYDIAVDTYTLISDINPGTNTTSSGTVRANNSSISNFTPFLNTLYFEALGVLYQTDGTTTIPVANAASLDGVSNLYKFNDALLFEGDNGTDGDQLYSLNTLTGALTQVSFISGANSAHDPSDYAFFNGVVYYAGEDNVDNEQHLFRTDGVEIRQMDDTVTNVDDVTVFNNLIYFEGEASDTIGIELYVFNPATASIEQLTGVKSVKIVQNPVKETIFLKGDTHEVQNYAIYDLAGRIVQSASFDGDQISHTLTSGTYILALNAQGITHSLKFIVE
jgi:ELWxxDGT repeat protein